MFIVFDDNRASDSPFIERVWRCHSERAGMFVSVATSHWDLVVTRLEDTLTLTLKGPETRAREVFCPANGEWLGIRFKAGTFMPELPLFRILDGDLDLPSGARTFRLDGHAWEYPSSLGRLIGLTPARIARNERQLSFLYKTAPPARD